jgi:CubicO group peptidase (beta-lactamase class C family)
MRLVEMGRLELDRPVCAYLPGLCLADMDVASRVTLRHLLTHTAGWVGDYFDDFGPGEDALAKMVVKMASLEQLTPLGEVWSYNNSGFYLAGRAIEVATGKSFEQALAELVLEPLGLEMTFFDAKDVITQRFVVGHEVIEGQPRVARPWALGRAANPAGGLISNIGDLFRYARFHMGDGTTGHGERLLRPQSLEMMQTPVVPASGVNSLGLTWFISDLDGTKIIEHGGGTKGQVTRLRLAPEKGFAVVVLTNGEHGGELCNQVSAAALQEFLGLSQPQPVPLELPAEKLQEYTGRYESSMDEHELSLVDAGLVLKVTYKGGFPTPDTPPPPSPGPMRMALYDQDRVIVLDSPMKDARGEFLRAPDGSIAWLRIGGRVNAKVG